MRTDVSTALTAIALIAGFGIVVTSIVSSGPSAVANVVVARALELEFSATKLVPGMSNEFLVSAGEFKQVVVSAEPDNEQIELKRMMSGESVWDKGTSTLYLAEGTQLRKSVKPEWSQLIFEDVFSGEYMLQSIAFDGRAVFVGTSNSQVYSVEGKTVTEQKFRAGVVTALACASERVVAATDDPDDEKKGTLYFLDGDDLAVMRSQPTGQVSRLLAVYDWAFLMVDQDGLWIGHATEGKMGVTLEIAGDVKLSHNSHDGYVVVSTGGATKLMRLTNGKLATVKNLSRGGIIDAAFNDNLLAVVYESTPRQVTVYRID